MTVKELKESLSEYPDNCEVKYTVDPLNDVTPWVYYGINDVSSFESASEDNVTVLLIG